MQGEVDRDRAGGGELGRGVDGRAAALAYGDDDGEYGRDEGGEDGEGAYEAGGGAAEEQAGGGAEEREEGDEDGEGRGGHAVASAFFAFPAGAVAWSSVLSPGRASAASVSAVSRRRSTSEVPRLR